MQRERAEREVAECKREASDRLDREKLQAAAEIEKATQDARFSLSLSLFLSLSFSLSLCVRVCMRAYICWLCRVAGWKSLFFRRFPAGSGFRV